MKQAKVPSDTEMKRLLAVIDAGRHGPRNRCAVMMSYLAGLRVGEIAQLTIADVFTTDGEVRDQIVLKAAYTKSNETRTIFVSKRLHNELERYKQSFPAMPASDKPFFMTQKRSPFSANTLCQLFGDLYRRAGIDGASSHSGRRSFITKLAHAGISSKVIMELAGHRSLSVTQRYIDVNDEMMKAAVEIV